MIKTIRNLSIIFFSHGYFGLSFDGAMLTVPTESAHDTVIKRMLLSWKKYDALPFYKSAKYEVYRDAVFLSEVSFYLQPLRILL